MLEYPGDEVCGGVDVAPAYNSTLQVEPEMEDVEKTVTLAHSDPPPPPRYTTSSSNPPVTSTIGGEPDPFAGGDADGSDDGSFEGCTLHRGGCTAGADFCGTTDQNEAGGSTGLVEVQC